MKTMTGKNPGTEKVWKAVSGICVFTAMLYFIGFYLWVMDIFEEQTQWLKSFYVNVNLTPSAAYFFGVSVLLFCAFYRNWVLKVILCILYILVVLFSLVAIMGMDSTADLLIYAPHLLIIGGIVYTFGKRCGKKSLNKSAKICSYLFLSVSVFILSSAGLGYCLFYGCIIVDFLLPAAALWVPAMSAN